MTSQVKKSTDKRPPVEELAITGPELGRLMRLADVTARSLAAFIDKRDPETGDGTRGKIAHTAQGIWKMKRRCSRRPVPIRYVRLLRDCIGADGFWSCYDRLRDEQRKEMAIRNARRHGG